MLVVYVFIFSIGSLEYLRGNYWLSLFILSNVVLAPVCFVFIDFNLQDVILIWYFIFENIWYFVRYSMHKELSLDLSSYDVALRTTLKKYTYFLGCIRKVLWRFWVLYAFLLLSLSYYFLSINYRLSFCFT